VLCSSHYIVVIVVASKDICTGADDSHEQAQEAPKTCERKLRRLGATSYYFSYFIFFNFFFASLGATTRTRKEATSPWGNFLLLIFFVFFVLLRFRLLLVVFCLVVLFCVPFPSPPFLARSLFLSRSLFISLSRSLAVLLSFLFFRFVAAWTHAHPRQKRGQSSPTQHPHPIHKHPTPRHNPRFEKYHATAQFFFFFFKKKEHNGGTKPPPRAEGEKKQESCVLFLSFFFFLVIIYFVGWGRLVGQGRRRMQVGRPSRDPPTLLRPATNGRRRRVVR